MYLLLPRFILHVILLLIRVRLFYALYASGQVMFRGVASSVL